MGAKARKKKKDKRELLSGPAIRARLGVPGRTWSAWIEAGLPSKKKPGGRRAFFDPVEVFKWFIAYKKENKTNKRRDDPLDEVRRQQAIAATRKNRIETGKLVEMEEVNMAMRELAHGFRATLAALERVHGHDVGDALREMITQMRERINERFGKNGKA